VAAVPSALTNVLDRLTGGRGDRIVRFGMVSVVGVALTQALLVLFHGIMNTDATVSNVLAVVLSSVPVFFLNKRWVWGRGGPAQLRREIIPFWVLTLLGLLLSTVLVAVVDRWSDHTWPVMLANIGGFGVVWVVKFFFLDAKVFGLDEAEGR
jgi:putative flippase GtrA